MLREQTWPSSRPVPMRPAPTRCRSTLRKRPVALAIEDGDVTLSGNALTLKTGSSINVLSGRTLTVTNSLANSTGETMSKDGSGTVILAAANNGMAGTFVLNSGTLGVGNNSAFGVTTLSSTLTINGGKLTNSTAVIKNVSAGVQVNLNADFTVDDSIDGTLISLNGVSVINGNRTITVNGPAGVSSTASKGLALRRVLESGGTYGITKQGPGTLSFESNT